LTRQVEKDSATFFDYFGSAITLTGQ